MDNTAPLNIASITVRPDLPPVAATAVFKDITTRMVDSAVKAPRITYEREHAFWDIREIGSATTLIASVLRIDPETNVQWASLMTAIGNHTEQFTRECQTGFSILETSHLTPSGFEIVTSLHFVLKDTDIWDDKERRDLDMYVEVANPYHMPGVLITLTNSGVKHRVSQQCWISDIFMPDGIHIEARMIAGYGPTFELSTFSTQYPPDVLREKLKTVASSYGLEEIDPVIWTAVDAHYAENWRMYNTRLGVSRFEIPTDALAVLPDMDWILVTAPAPAPVIVTLYEEQPTVATDFETDDDLTPSIDDEPPAEPAPRSKKR